MTDLLQRVRERKLGQWALAYLAGGWVLLQGLDLIGHQFGWPPGLLRGITVALGVGFFAALVLAWYHGERGAQKISGTELLILALLLSIGGALLWMFARNASSSMTRSALHAAATDRKSIAVLPFINMSGDKNNEYFSDGISEEILNVLAKTPALLVAARTSSFAFKGKAMKVPAIARELNVRMVLEGSVRKQGERVRITAQLIDASNGYHVWSQTYDRDLKDIFAIQDEIANAIAKELNVKLNAAPAGATVPDTTSLKAYDLYLKGIGLWQGRGDKNLHEAISDFRAALALDPDYAKAWAGLALTYAILPEWSNDLLEQTRPLGRDAAEHAMALDRDLPEPYAVLGYIAGSEFRFATARAMYRRSIALSPSYATGHQWFGETLGTEGDLDKSVAMLRKAAVLDPKSAIVGSVLAGQLVSAGHEDEGLAVCDSIVGIERDWCPLLHYDVAMSRKDYAGARAALEESVAVRGPAAQRLFDAQMDVLGGKGDAVAIGRQLLDLPDGQSNPDGLTPMSASDSMFWYMAIGRNDLAIERFARYARLVPYGARTFAFDRHFATLHCEPRFVEILRSLKVEEPHLAAACPKGQ